MKYNFEAAVKKCIEQAVREYELTVGMTVEHALEK